MPSTTFYRSCKSPSPDRAFPSRMTLAIVFGGCPAFGVETCGESFSAVWEGVGGADVHLEGLPVCALRCPRRFPGPASRAAGGGCDAVTFRGCAIVPGTIAASGRFVGGSARPTCAVFFGTNRSEGATSPSRFRAISLRISRSHRQQDLQEAPSSFREGASRQ